MLEALLYSMSQPPALKPALKNAELRAALRDFVAALSQPDKVRPVLGGASAIIAEFLSQLGVANTRLYSSYRSTAIARLFRGEAVALEVDRTGSVAAGRRVKDAGEQTHPTRSSYILPYNAGRKIADPTRPKGLLRHPQTGEPITARQDDRLIYRVFNYLQDHAQQWNEVIIETDNGELLQGPAGLGKDEWPFVAGFVDWEVTPDEKLKIRFLNQAKMAEIGRRFRYVILNAPGLRAFTGPESVLPQEALAKTLGEALVKQMAALREAGCKIHLELSGGAGEKDRLMPFARSLRGLIGSLGLNQEELRQVTNLPDCPQPQESIPHPSEVFNRYQRAAVGRDAQRG
jgi:ADP-dependent phosphofructokinase/glucokinase